MANLCTFDCGTCSLEMLWLLQVTPAMLRGLVDEMWPENEEAVS
jgi:hypothetical protein